MEGYTQVLDLQEDNCTKRIIGMTEIIRTEELMTKSEDFSVNCALDVMSK